MRRIRPLGSLRTASRSRSIRVGVIPLMPLLNHIPPFMGSGRTTVRPEIGIRLTNGMPENGRMDDCARQAELAALAKIVRRNLQALMDGAKDGTLVGPIGVLALEAESGVGKSTIYRILAPTGKNDTSMGNLHALAQCYGFDGWQLLHEGINIYDADEIDVALAVYRQIQDLADRGRNPAATHHPGAQGAGPRNSLDRPNTGPQSPRRPKAPRP